jgi:hypothetical protein
MVKTRAMVLAESVKTRLVENLIQAAIERVTRSDRQLTSVPKRLLSLPLLPRAHRHNPILKPKHFMVKMLFEFRHGLLAMADQEAAIPKICRNCIGV